MTIDEKTAASKAEYQGKTYYFCTLHCKRAFGKDPAKYVGQSSSPMDQQGQHER
jgi:YHS domain-containing protein